MFRQRRTARHRRPYRRIPVAMRARPPAGIDGARADAAAAHSAAAHGAGRAMSTAAGAGACLLARARLWEHRAPQATREIPVPMRIAATLLLATALPLAAAAQEAPMGPLRPDQVEFRALYKELVETNTTLSS